MKAYIRAKLEKAVSGTFGGLVLGIVVLLIAPVWVLVEILWNTANVLLGRYHIKVIKRPYGVEEAPETGAKTGA